MSILTNGDTLLAASSTGNQSFVGVGFQPKVVIFWITGQTAHGTSTGLMRLSFGWVTGSSEQGCITYASDSGEGTSVVKQDHRSDRCIIVRGSLSGNIIGEASFVSFDANGFTINWIDAISGAIVHFVAIGGDDLTNAKVGKFSKKTSTGNQSTTGVGFKPDVILMTGVTATTEDTASAHMGFFLGTAKSAASRWCTGGFAKDGAGTSNTGRFQRTNRCILQTDEDGAVVSEADFVSMDTDGFTINYSTADANAYGYFYLALKGGAYKVGSFSGATSTGNKSVFGVGFQPEMEISASFCAALSGSVIDDYFMNLGIGLTSTDRRTVWNSDEDAQNTTDSSRAISNTKIFRTFTVGTASINAEADFVSQDADGFTWNWSTADAIAREILYLAIGNAIDAALPVDVCITICNVKYDDNQQDSQPPKTHIVGRELADDKFRIFDTFTSASGAQFDVQERAVNDPDRKYLALSTASDFELLDLKRQLPIAGDHTDTIFRVINEIPCRTFVPLIGNFVSWNLSKPNAASGLTLEWSWTPDTSGIGKIEFVATVQPLPSGGAFGQASGISGVIKLVSSGWLPINYRHNIRLPNAVANLEEFVLNLQRTI